MGKKSGNWKVDHTLDRAFANDDSLDYEKRTGEWVLELRCEKMYLQFSWNSLL